MLTTLLLVFIAVNLWILRRNLYTLNSNIITIAIAAKIPISRKK